MRESAKEIKSLGFKVGLVSMPEKFPIGVAKWGMSPPIDKYPEYKETGVCLHTGEVEIVDVDSKHWHEEGDFSQIFLDRVRVLTFFDKLVYYKTINNGLQLPYRTKSAQGNQKLATRLGYKEAVIETRGKGGLAVCPPTKGYEWLDGGEWEAVPKLSIDERAELLAVCREWNQGGEVEIPDHVTDYKENLGKAGDDWASKNDFITYIKGQGWSVDKVIGEAILLRRPGKEIGTSASWNYKGSGRLFCFSSSAGLPTEKLLKPFAVKAYLEHDGNFKKCASSLRSSGYGNDTLTMVESCETCENWGQVALILNDNKDKIDMQFWNDLSYGIQALDIKGVTESKLNAFKKTAVSVIGWEDGLTFDDDEKVKDKIYNIDLILNHDDRYKGIFFYDDFNQRIIIKRKSEIVEFDDTYMSLLRVRLGREWGHFRAADIEAVITTIAKHNHFHPVQEKIKSVKWDGVNRADTWLSTFCGAEDSSYSRIVSRKWLISAIARLFRAGCKVDNMLILEGEQGTKKSSMLRMLCYDNFLDGGIDIRNKDGLMSLFGKWVVEFAELEGLNGRTSDQVKAYLAKQDDKIRLPYGKSENYFKRTCVFVGTTNKDYYLNDPSGNRRFWPIKINKVNLKGLEAVRDQIWAESLLLFEKGEKWWVDEESEEAKHFTHQQKERVVHSDLEDKIIEYLEENVRDDGRVMVKLHEIWTHCLGGKLNNLDRRKEHELASCLRLIGLQKGRATYKGKAFKGWVGRIEGGK